MPNGKRQTYRSGGEVMRDPRFEQLAQVLVGHSTRVQPGDKVLVEATDVPEEFICVLIEQIVKAGGIPLVDTKHSKLMRTLQMHATEEQLQVIADVEKYRMEKMQCYIGVRGTMNSAQMSDVPVEKVEMVQRLWWKPVHSDVRVPNTRWVVLRWPNDSMAQQANMSTEAFEDYYFHVCTLDYSRMEKAVQPLVELMSQTDRVRLVGPGTDLRFSIRISRSSPATDCATSPMASVLPLRCAIRWKARLPSMCPRSITARPLKTFIWCSGQARLWMPPATSPTS
jgi:aminopeptidase